MSGLFARITLLFSLLLSGGLFAADTVPETSIIKDWAVACNNLRQCEAVSLRLPVFGNADSKEYDAVLSFRRDAGVGAAAEFFVAAGSFLNEAPDVLVGQPTILSAGGVSLDAGTYATNDKGEFVVPGSLTDQLVAMVRKPAELTVKVGTQQFQASLRGITAAMLYTDEQQQRLDTPTALVQRGEQIMTATPPQVAAVKVVKAPANMTAPENLAAQVRTAQGEIMRKSDCSEAPNTDLDFASLLDANHYLVGLSCWLAAYNTQSVLFKVSAETGAGKPRTAVISVPGGEGNAVSGANFNQTTGILSTYYKGRGLGDCGGYSEYAWNGQRFVLIRAGEMPDCRGTPAFLNVWRLPVE